MRMARSALALRQVELAILHDEMDFDLGIFFQEIVEPRHQP